MVEFPMRVVQEENVVRGMKMHPNHMYCTVHSRGELLE